VAKLTKPLRKTKISAALLALVFSAACLVPAAMASEGAPPPPHGHGHGHHGPTVALHGPSAGHVHGMVPAAQGGGEASGGATLQSGTHVDLGQTSFSSTENLAYHEGPVLHTNTTYAIYWVPPGSTVSAKYTSVINGFLTNVALASGYSSTVFATDTQYHDSEGPITSKSSFGGSYLDTSTPIPADCSGYQESPVTVSGCVTDADIQAEVNHAIAAAGWTPGPTKEFFLFTPRNVGSCLSSTSTECSFTYYCAYHSSFTDGLSRQVLYSNLAYPDSAEIGAPGACDSYQHPNGDWADSTINTLSHEHNESITDPLGTSWFDGVGNENGDKCAWNFGTPLGSTSYGQYNQVIGKGKYYLQQEWSNASHSCALKYLPTPVVWNFTPSSGASSSEVTLTGANFTATKSVTFNGTSASFTVISPETIIAKVPLSVTSGPIAVTNGYGTGTSSSSFWAAPTVTSLSSTSGKTTTLLTVYGTNFTGATSVTFGGAPATFKISEAKKLTATVPAGAETGTITVSTPGGTATSPTNFTVVPWAPPTITSFSSTSGKTGALITIYGTSFASASQVTIGGIPATFKISEEKKLTATVPPGAETGTITVTNPGGTGTSPTNFTVIPWAPPTITSFSSTSGKPGALITVYGTNFASASQVTIGGTPATFKISEEKKLVATVPPGAETGTITVTNPGGTATSTTNYTVLP